MTSDTRGLRRLPLADAPSAEQLAAELPHGYLRARRAAEILLILVAAPLAAALCLFAACAVWLETRHGVLLRQERPGRHGTLFRMLKLRTMVPSAALAGGLTRPHDPRVTRVGRVLRRLRLDELPQLWNVLRGEMGLIGPRPEPAVLSRDLERQIPLYALRRVVPPGITGLAQVYQGYTDSIDGACVKLEYDLFYITHLSFALDLRILAKTIHTVLSGFGAR